MCICMRDKELIVRENTLSLMIQLIQEDYLKLRCPVFFHILTMLLDRKQCIRDMVSSFLINSLLVKRKNIMVQHFVESLFHYNGYTVSVNILYYIEKKFILVLSNIIVFNDNNTFGTHYMRHHVRLFDSMLTSARMSKSEVYPHNWLL